MVAGNGHLERIVTRCSTSGPEQARRAFAVHFHRCRRGNPPAARSARARPARLHSNGRESKIGACRGNPIRSKRASRGIFAAGDFAVRRETLRLLGRRRQHG